MARGLAGVKFSGSPNKFGENSAKAASEISINANPKMSLME